MELEAFQPIEHGVITQYGCWNGSNHYQDHKVFDQ